MTAPIRHFRVKSATEAVDLGSALAHALSDGQSVELRAIGASAVNQAVKAIPIAQGYVAPYGMTLLTTIRFVNAEVPDVGTVSALSFIVEGVTGWASDKRRNQVLTTAASTALH